MCKNLNLQKLTPPMDFEPRTLCLLGRYFNHWAAVEHCFRISIEKYELLNNTRYVVRTV